MTDWEVLDSSSFASFEYSTSDDSSSLSLREITRRHWKSNESRPNCRGCKKKFSLLIRPHHCRCCGDVFCAACVQFRRLLNLLAHPDPNGRLYRVCKVCFEKDRDTHGASRCLRVMFERCKHEVRIQRQMQKTGNTSLRQTWRSKIDLNAESERLRAGFWKSISKSDVRRAVGEIRQLVTTPEWQKSSSWLQETMTDKCQFCSVTFGLLTSRQVCKLCGRAMCKKCSRRELLVYLPDDKDADLTAEKTDVQIAIIKIVGCPEIEPSVSVLLHVCDGCREFVMSRQVAVATQPVTPDEQAPVTASLVTLNDKLTSLQEKINNNLSKYTSVVESLEDGSTSSSGESNTKFLAKAQNDLSDYFATYCLYVPTIKKLLQKADTDKTREMINNFLKAKSGFYLENVNTFRQLRRKLSDSAPEQMLDYIQKIVDKNAIVSAQIYIRQLTFESINLCMKYKLDSDRLPQLLAHLDQVIEQETHQCLRCQGEDLESHSNHLKDIVHIQMKEHQLVKVSRRQLASVGPRHVADILLGRVGEVLNQVSIQLDMKAMQRSFPDTKVALEKARKMAGQVTISDLMS